MQPAQNQIEKSQDCSTDIVETAESKLLESLADICFDKWIMEKGKQRKAKLVLRESTESAEMRDKSPP